MTGGVGELNFFFFFFSLMLGSVVLYILVPSTAAACRVDVRVACLGASFSTSGFQEHSFSRRGDRLIGKKNCLGSHRVKQHHCDGCSYRRRLARHRAFSFNYDYKRGPIAFGLQISSLPLQALLSLRSPRRIRQGRKIAAG